MELKGKTILITGGTAGIGLESVKQFLSTCLKNKDPGQITVAFPAMGFGDPPFIFFDLPSPFLQRTR
jgi:hypothetical protein